MICRLTNKNGSVKGGDISIASRAKMFLFHWLQLFTKEACQVFNIPHCWKNSHDYPGLIYRAPSLVFPIWAFLGVFLPYSHQFIVLWALISLKWLLLYDMKSRLTKVVFFLFWHQVSALDVHRAIVDGPVPITIIVKDINDNQPTFLQSKYEGSVRQNSRPGNKQYPEDIFGKMEKYQVEWE